MSKSGHNRSRSRSRRDKRAQTQKSSINRVVSIKGKSKDSRESRESKRSSTQRDSKRSKKSIDTNAFKVYQEYPELCNELYHDEEVTLQNMAEEDRRVSQRFAAYTADVKYPHFRCFTMKLASGVDCIVTIHDTTLFEDHALSVCVGSHSGHTSIIVQKATMYQNQITVQFKCYDCGRRETDCAPWAMYHIVHYGVPKVLCKKCWTDSGAYPRYSRTSEELFSKFISDPKIATVQLQSVARLDTFVVENNNERRRLVG